MSSNSFVFSTSTSFLIVNIFIGGRARYVSCAILIISLPLVLQLHCFFPSKEMIVFTENILLMRLSESGLMTVWWFRAKIAKRWTIRSYVRSMLSRAHHDFVALSLVNALLGRGEILSEWKTVLAMVRIVNSLISWVLIIFGHSHGTAGMETIEHSFGLSSGSRTGQELRVIRLRTVCSHILNSAEIILRLSSSPIKQYSCRAKTFLFFNVLWVLVVCWLEKPRDRVWFRMSGCLQWRLAADLGHFGKLILEELIFLKLRLFHWLRLHDFVRWDEIRRIALLKRSY